MRPEFVAQVTFTEWTKTADIWIRLQPRPQRAGAGALPREQECELGVPHVVRDGTTAPGRAIAGQGVQAPWTPADIRGMSIYQYGIFVFLLFVIAILYIMRRRTRQGRRTPKF